MDTADGRAERSTRTRVKILTALFELVQEGNLKPRGEEIAQKASIAVRTIFRHFDDMDGLFRAAQAHLGTLLSADIEQPQLEGSLEERARAHAQAQGSLFDSVRNYILFYIAHTQSTKDANTMRTMSVQNQRLRLWAALPECAAAQSPSQQAVEALYSFQCWDQFRFEQGRSYEEAVNAIASSAVALLKAGDRRTQISA